jgi:hypothetical protein
MPDDKTQANRLRWLFGISAAVHFGLAIFCLVKGVQTAPPAPQLYSFYRPRISGERTSAGAANASNASNASFIQDLEQAYAKACPLQNSAPRPLLMMEAAFDAKLGLRQVRQTWMPERYALFGMAEVNGFLILAVVFASSFLLQAICLYFCFEENPLRLFRQPCFLRWLEYACTSPLQIVLVASCVLIRDVHTVTLLFAAQLVCVLLGFVTESANAPHAVRAHTHPVHTAAIAFQDPPDAPDAPAQKGPGPSDAETGPPAQETTSLLAANEHAEPPHTHARNALGLWLVGFLAATILHVAVWYILIDQLSNVDHETACHEKTPGSEDWKTPLQIVVYGQCILFSLFGLVPLLQEIVFWRGRTPVPDVFLYGSLVYAFLSVAAKVFLAASYVAFVALFPFTTMQN